MSEFQAGVGFSRNLNPKIAGEEVIASALENLDKDPKFVLLFSTIHYARKERKGMQKFVEAAYDALPKKAIPMIGGSVAGFINKHGVFAKGATALAVYCDVMDVAAGYGKGVKRNPRKAARNCAKMIKQKKKNKYKSKLLINIISSPTVPTLPKIGRINVVKSKILGELLTYLTPIFSLKGQGIGEEFLAIEELSNILQEYRIIGGSATDDGQCFESYQFFNSQTYRDSIVALAISTTFNIIMKTSSRLVEVKEFEITQTFRERIIRKINKTKAKKYFFSKVLGVPSELFKKLGPFYHKASMHFPLGTPDKTFITALGGIFGDNLVLGHKLPQKNLATFSIDGKNLKKSFEDIIFKKAKIEDIPLTAILIISIGYLVSLGYKVSYIRKFINKLNIPYLGIFSLTENIRINKKLYTRAYSINLLVLNKKTKNEF